MNSDIGEGTEKNIKITKILRGHVTDTKRIIADISEISFPGTFSQKTTKENVKLLLYMCQNVLNNLYFNIIHSVIQDFMTIKDDKEKVEQLFEFLQENFAEGIQHMYKDVYGIK